jgi:benzoate membrane transport protein
MLITSAAGIAMPEAIGVFIVCATLITLVGFAGWFERAIERIPLVLAAAMLAGVLALLVLRTGTMAAPPTSR